MAATTINSYSTDLAANLAPLYAPIKPNIMHGRVRAVYFRKVFATEAAGEDVALAVIPKGARILGGVAGVSATTGSATLSYGLMAKDASGTLDVAAAVSDDVAALKAAAAQTTTAQVALAATPALYYGYETEKELYLTVTTAAAAMAGQTLTGHLLYTVD